MKTEKRFKPSTLARFIRQGRSMGTYDAFSGWHMVTRGDPSSYGRSHIFRHGGRQLDLLSDVELETMYFARMVRHLADLREQHAISLEDAPSEHCLYDARHSTQLIPGTLSIAASMGIRHPVIRWEGQTYNWQMTTDQVLVIWAPGSGIELLAVSVKFDEKDLTPRQMDLLYRIEKQYWTLRKVTWILVTRNQYNRLVGLTLCRTAPWALGTVVSNMQLSAAEQIALSRPESTYQQLVKEISARLGDAELAKRALWQAVWMGLLPIDLSRDWRPYHPFTYLSDEEFWAQNPIVSRRSA